MKITSYLFPSDVHRLLPEYSREDMVSITVTIENEIIKKTHRDHRTVEAIFIKVSKTPGVQIFVLEPTKNDLRNSKFTLEANTNLTIHANGWVYQSTKITFPKRPSHPIVYATLIGYELPANQPTISFDPYQAKRRFKMVERGWTPDKINSRASEETALELLNESDYLIGEIKNGAKSRPIHMKFLDNHFRNYKDYDYFRHFGHFVEDMHTYKIGVLETNSYFIRCHFTLEKGCILFDGSKEYLVTDVWYLDFPSFPLIFAIDWNSKENAA